MDILGGGSSWPLFPGRIGTWNFGLCGGRKTGGPGEKPQEQGREQPQTQPTCDITSGSRTQATAVGQDTFLDVPCSKCLGSSCNMCHGREDTV